MRDRSMTLIAMVDRLDAASAAVPTDRAKDRIRINGVSRRLKSRVVESEWMDLEDLIGDDLPEITGLPWLAHLRKWTAIAEVVTYGSEADQVTVSQIGWGYPHPVSMTYERMRALQDESLPEYLRTRPEPNGMRS